MNEYRRLAVDVSQERPDLSLRVAEHLLRYGRSFDSAGMPFIIGTAAEDVSELIIELTRHDLDRGLMLTQLLSDNLAGLASSSSNVSVAGVLKACVKLGLWAVAENQKDVLNRISQGLTAIDAELVENSLDRMEMTTERVFWEVSDRVVAYDWVEDHLRELIPVLRAHLHPQEPSRPARPRVRRDGNGTAKKVPTKVPAKEASTALPSA